MNSQNEQSSPSKTGEAGQNPETNRRSKILPVEGNSAGLRESETRLVRVHQTIGDLEGQK